MKITEERKRNFLLILIVLLSISIFFQFSGTPDQQPAPVRALAKPPNPVDKTDVLDTGLLTLETPRFFNEKRNLFQFKAGSQDLEAQTQPAGWLKIQPPAEVKPAVPDVHYLGFYLEKNNPAVRLAAISNSGRIYVGKVGDTLGGRYQVLQIEKVFLLLKLVDEEKVIRLTLGKQSGVFVDSEEEEKDSEDE